MFAKGPSGCSLGPLMTCKSVRCGRGYANLPERLFLQLCPASNNLFKFMQIGTDLLEVPTRRLTGDLNELQIYANRGGAMQMSARGSVSNTGGKNSRSL